jgi:hypothetical protein
MPLNHKVFGNWFLFLNHVFPCYNVLTIKVPTNCNIPRNHTSLKQCIKQHTKNTQSPNLGQCISINNQDDNLLLVFLAYLLIYIFQSLYFFKHNHILILTNFQQINNKQLVKSYIQTFTNPISTFFHTHF